MFEARQYDRPPAYNNPPATNSRFSAPRSVHSLRSQYVPYAYNVSNHRPPDSCVYAEERPQFFFRWFSPPGFVKTFQAATVLMCFLIFACVASTLVWEMHGVGYGGTGAGVAPPGAVGGIGSAGGTSGSGYYGGSYGYASGYMTPYSAKSAMISVAAINFLVGLGFLVGSFSRSPSMRSRCFYLTVFVCDVVLAVLQGIIDIVFVIGVNPMSQSSQSMLYNPMLMMCQNIPNRPSLSGSVGAGFPGGFPMYTQYLQRYCFMDPEEAVALVLGLMVVLALSLAAYFAYKTRSKIWRHGKPNIYWDRPLSGQSEGHHVLDWVNSVGRARSIPQAPTVVLSERAAPVADHLRAVDSVVSYGNRTVSIYSQGNTYGGNNNTNTRGAEPTSANPSRAPVRPNNSSSDEADSIQKKHLQPVEKKATWRPLERQPVMGSPAAREEVVEYETGYTTGGESGNELAQDQADYLFRLYPEITSDEQRREYRREFDADRARYKRLCAEMDDVSDRIHKLSRELDTLGQSSVTYQGVTDEYNRLKELKRTTDYQAKKKQSKELRQKLFHIKRLVKNYDHGLC